MEDDREKIFASIRRRLRGNDAFKAERDARSPLINPVGKGFDTLFTKFKSELSALGGEAVAVDSETAAAKFVADHTDEKDLVFLYDDVKETKPDFSAALTGSRRVRSETGSDGSYGKEELAQIDCAVSGCLMCIAETGTVVINTASRLPAALAASLFVILDSNLLLPSLDELFTDTLSNFDGSSLFLITGPSRTADIEKQLVKGVHGPKRVCVIFLQH